MDVSYSDLLDSIEKTANIGGWWLELNSNKLFWSKNTRVIHEVAPDYEPQLETALDFYIAPYKEILKNAVELTIHTGNPFELRAKIRTQCGHVRWVKVFGMLREYNPSKKVLFGAIQNISADIELENKLIQNKIEHEATLNSIFEALITIDSEGNIVSCNNTAAEMFQYKESDIIRQSIYKLLPDRSKSVYTHYITADQKKPNAMGINKELMAIKSNGVQFPIQLSIKPLETLSGKAFISTIRDLSKEKSMTQELEFLTSYDKLTELPNRFSLIKYLNMESNKETSLLAINIDNFNRINIAHGSNEGDAVLKELSSLLTHLSNEYSYTVRDLSDKFLVVINEPPLLKYNSVDHFINTLRQTLNNPIFGNTNRHFLSISIGVASRVSDEISSEQLISNAETALFAAKSNGKGKTNYFHSTQSDQVLSDYQLESELRTALEQNEFTFWFQPKIDNKNQIVSAEMLIRWIRNGVPYSSPDKFIPIAENNQLIDALGDLAIHNAALRLKQINDFNPQFSIAINVSPNQLLNPDFAENLLTAFQIHGANTNNLIIEVTEGLLIYDLDTTSKIINSLTAMGVKVSIDDFGTGYSNMRRIIDLNISELKIDKSFILDINTSQKSQVLVKSICQMAKLLNLTLVAEGVENISTVNWCKEQEFDILQGFYYGKPTSFEQFIQSLK